MPFLPRKPILLLSLAGLALTIFAPAVHARRRQAADAAGDVFIAKPYLQLGQAVKLSPREAMAVVWQTPDADAQWMLEVRSDKGAAWTKMDAPTMHRVAVGGIAPHRVYTATAKELTPGDPFHYRVSKDGKAVFEAVGRARKAAGMSYRFVAFGDCAAGTEPQKQIAYQTYQLKPDFVLITGDIVYSRGRVSEYREKYFPVYNAEQPDPAVGAPLSRSTLIVGVPGNHDILHPDFDQYPDAMAYYYYWAQPLNGPVDKPGTGLVAPFKGPEADQKAFLDAAKENYPRMANFSFDYGNAHWTILDSNPYVDWTNPDLRAWVEKDIASAKNATWRFVSFHHPGFNSSKEHFTDQQMRLLADIFQNNKVDVVFSGHVHNYQRVYPLTYAVKRNADGSLKGVREASGAVPGDWTLDKTFDGATNTKPKGVLYLITGGGGAHLYNPEQQDKPETWQAFTCKYVADVNSLTVVDVNGKTLNFRQISATGKELDRFTITK